MQPSLHPPAPGWPQHHASPQDVMAAEGRAAGSPALGHFWPSPQMGCDIFFLW